MIVPDLNRRWTLADAAEVLWKYRISIKLRGGGYHVRDLRKASPPPGYVTDDLIEALIAGLGTASHPPATLSKRRRRRPRPTRKAGIRRHNRAVARRKWKHLCPHPK